MPDNTLSPMTVREAIKALASTGDLDAEVSMVVINSDPIPIVSLEEQQDGAVCFQDATSAQDEEDETAEETEIKLG